jgi:thymidylate synthase
MHNLDMLWDKTIQNLLSKGETPTRLGSSKEIIGYQGLLTNPWMNVVTNGVRQFSLPYACAEMLWYLSGENNIGLIKQYAPSYVKYAEDDIAWGAYGKRWAIKPHQLDLVNDILEQDPISRQAIMTMYNVGDLIAVHDGGKGDIPCTLTLQFLLRDRKLNLITNMRSNDVWLGFPYDVFCFTYLQMILSAMLDVECGIYIHQSGSEHIYSKHYDKAWNALEEGCGDRITTRPVLHWDGRDWKEQVRLSLQLEEAGRGQVFMIPEMRKLHPLFQDLVMGTWMKWGLVEEKLNNELYEQVRSAPNET